MHKKPTGRHAAISQKLEASPAIDPTAAAPRAGNPDDQAQLRTKLGEYLRGVRLTHNPVYTQMELSKKLGFTYAAVTGWENGSRRILHKQMLTWAEVFGVSTDLKHGPFAPYASVLLPSELSKPNKGSRIEDDINARMLALRQERNLTLREMGEATGIDYHHLMRIEHNKSNLTLGQLRQVAKRFDVSYEWLMDGLHPHESREGLRQRIAQLERENELLESFRLSTLR